MTERPTLRVLRDCLVLVILAVLPAAAAGCARAMAHHRFFDPSELTTAQRQELRNMGNGSPPPAGAFASGGFGGGEAMRRSRGAGGFGGAGFGGGGFGQPPLLPLDLGEELWVIQKPDAPFAPDDEDGLCPGTGCLATRDPRGSEREIPLPLKHTDVKAAVAGYIATVDVTQQFHNPYDGKIEAVYTFPLPDNAAVNEFVMTIGDRHIRGIIRERQEAEKIYREARSQGYVATLLTQERPNVFTQSVANIEPGKQIDVHIKYFNTLTYSDGWYEFVFPMVVGPRFNPPGSTDGVGAVGRGSHGTSKQKAEVQYLRPGERSGHDIALSVRLDAGVPFQEVESRNHKVAVSKDSPRRAVVTLDAADSIPNRDFVLRWKVAGDEVTSGLLVHRDDRDGAAAGGYFSLMLVPPDDLKKLPRSPLEMVFTLDVSGSMEGAPIAQSKAAMRYALSHMGPDDTFQIVRFAGNADVMFPRPVPATPQNVRRALHDIDRTSAGGGTMMLEGIRRSLEFPADESRPRCVAFLTDGYIGNETEILRVLHQSLRDSRVFSFGVGSAPNRYLLEHMAALGNGAVAYLGLRDRAEGVMAAYFDRISHPALTSLSFDWSGSQVSEVFPQRAPDLFVGRPVILTGRFAGAPPTRVKVTGHVRGEPQTLEVAAASADAEDASAPGASKALPQVWARAKIADLADRANWEPSADLPAQVKQLALEYGLMSAYTSFVAVDSLTRTTGSHGTTVAVPVPVPDGVRYETTVAESPAQTADSSDPAKEHAAPAGLD